MAEPGIDPETSRTRDLRATERTDEACPQRLLGVLGMEDLAPKAWRYSSAEGAAERPTGSSRRFSAILACSAAASRSALARSSLVLDAAPPGGRMPPDDAEPGRLPPRLPGCRIGANWPPAEPGGRLALLVDKELPGREGSGAFAPPWLLGTRLAGRGEGSSTASATACSPPLPRSEAPKLAGVVGRCSISPPIMEAATAPARKLPLRLPPCICLTMFACAVATAIDSRSISSSASADGASAR
mmetsp:Transcript_30054/g.77130  ORF Transcript_30054/g.77130 Transcript_30054/m.77130 type:complete len:243 (+) Transcript_30054:90-818(+)